MIYAPHILEKKILSIVRDEYGRVSSSQEKYVKVCACRCDDNNFKKFVTEGGKVYRPQYHIVSQRAVNVRPGDEIRVMSDGELRASGTVFNIKSLNYLNYMEIWV